MLVDGPLSQTRLRLQELLGDITKRPEMAGPLADELERVFSVLRSYAYFVDYQRRELQELCQEMDRL